MPPISLDPTPLEQTISLDTRSAGTLPISADVAGVRATKAQFGLPDVNIPYDDYYNLIQSGKENALRTQVASELDLKRATEKQQLIANFAKNTKRPMDLKDYEDLSYTVGSDKPTDSRHVFEDKYSRRYLETMYKVAKDNPGTWFDDAMREVPKHVNKAIERGVGLMSRQQYMVKGWEDAQEALESQSTIGGIADKAKTIVPFYVESKLRGNVDLNNYIAGPEGWKGILKTGGLLGNVLEAERIKLINEPDDDKFYTTYDRIKKKLIEDNPEIAVQWTASMLGQSHSEQQHNNMETPLNLAMIPAMVEGLGKATIAAITGRAALVNKVKKAVRGMVESSTQTDIPLPTADSQDMQKAFGVIPANRALVPIPRKTATPEEPYSPFRVPFRPGPEAGPESDAYKAFVDDGTKEVFQNPQSKQIIDQNKAFVDDGTREVFQEKGAVDASSDNFRAHVDDGSREVHQDAPITPVQPVTSGPAYEAFVGQGADEVFTGAGRAVELFKRLNTAEKPEVAALGATGDFPAAARAKVVSRGLAGFEGTNNVEREGFEALPSSFKANLQNRLDNIGQNGQEIVNRMNTRSLNFLNDFINGIKNVGKVTRLNDIMSLDMVSRALEQATAELPGLRNRVLDSILQHHEGLNEYYVHLAIGRNNGQLFSSVREAEVVAELEGIVKPDIIKSDLAMDIKSKGFGYYIDLPMPVDERQPLIRGFLVTTDNAAKVAESLLTHVSQWRTAESTLSLDQRENRKILTYAPASLLKVFEDHFKDLITTANRQFRGQNFAQAYKGMGRWRDWDDAIRAEADQVDPATGIRGYFFKNTRELNSWYQRVKGRLPDNVETEAYFAFTDMHESLKMLQQLEAHKMATRVGVKQHQWTVIGENGEVLETPWINATQVPKLPGGDWTIAVLGGKKGEEQIIRGNHIKFQAQRNLLDRQIATGFMDAFEVYDTEARALENFSPLFKDTKIRYVVASGTASKNLDFNILPRSEGGLIEYDFGHAIKQAKIFKEMIPGTPNVYHYEGDTPVMALSHKGMGPDVIKKMDVVRNLIKAGDEAGAKIAARELPFPWEDHRGWYNPTKDIKGNTIPPKLSLDEPFYVVGKDEMIGKIDKTLEARFTNPDTKETYVDGTTSGSLARQSQVAFTGDRDIYELFTLRNKGKGTRYNPLYSYEPTKTLDLISTLDRATSKVTNSQWLSDYNAFSIETWVKEAKNFLRADLDTQFYSPNHVFSTADSKAAFMSDAPPAVVANLLQARYKIKQLLGNNELQNTLDSWSQQLADSIFEKQGFGFSKDVPFLQRRGFSEKTLLYPSQMLAHASDPVKWLRSMSFHTSMGIFSPTQLLQQSMTLINIGAIHPRYAMAGTYATLLHQWGRLNPGMLATLDEKATKLNAFGVRYKPGEFTEAVEQLKRTGFSIVGNEHSYSLEQASMKLVQSGALQALDMGQVFFRGAERNVRYAAWFTAMKEFRDHNPVEVVGKITQEHLNSILEKAVMYSGNMDRSSRSQLERGIFSIPTQFMSYPMRLADMILDGRLTGAESARVIAAQALFFGVPVGMSVAVYPFGEHFRQAALAYNYVVGDNFISSFINEGLLAYAAASATGYGDAKKGNWYNIGPKSGSPGVQALKDVITGDSGLWKIYMGAPGTFIENTVNFTGGLRRSLMSFIRQDGEHPFVMDDATEPLKISTTGNMLSRLKEVLNSGKWYNRNEQVTAEDVSKLNAAFMSVTGYQPSKVTDTRYLTSQAKSEDEQYKRAEKIFQKEIRRSLRAELDDNPQQAQDFRRRGFNALKQAGVPETEYEKIFQRAEGLNEDITRRIEMQAGIGKRIPEYRKEAAEDLYQRRLQMQNKQSGQ